MTRIAAATSTTGSASGDAAAPPSAFHARSDPRTGAPFAGDLPAIFDVYYSREVPDEGETLLAFVEGDLYASRRAQDAASPEELEDATRYWLSLSEREQGSLDTPGGTSRYVALPVEGADGTDGLFVVANFPTFERAEIDEAVRTQSIIQVGVFVVASLLALILAGRVLRPLGDLAVAAREISETDLGKRIPVRGRDEASQIAATFNAMLARLQRAFRDQRQFLDDTGHELRAPLTIIRGHVELIELDEEPETRRATAALVLDEIDRASRLIDDLLLLARAEQPDFIRPAPTDLVDLVLRRHEKGNDAGRASLEGRHPRSRRRRCRPRPAHPSDSAAGPQCNQAHRRRGPDRDWWRTHRRAAKALG